jgi:hypothetical protein
MMRWEYKILQNANVEEMNRLGLQGWEAINITILPNELPIVFFKRELSWNDVRAKELLNS